MLQAFPRVRDGSMARASTPASAALTHCVILGMLCSLLAGCARQSDAPATTAAPPPVQAVPAASDSPGKILGKAPAPTGGGTVVVVLEPQTPRTFAPQEEKPIMDQVGLSFGPDVLLVRTGQPVEFRNNDDTLHNVHVSHDETHEPAFNVAIPTGGSYTYTFARDGFYRVGCDIHPSMGATIFSSTTPFAALAEPDGHFVFEDVPAGAWTVSVYAAGRQLRREVVVHGGVTDVTIE